MSKTATADRGQVNVVTLVVFIAMLLVAAIASGVLVTLAGELQSRSDQATREDGQQEAAAVQVTEIVGTQIDADSGRVGAVNLTVGLSPTASRVDISAATLVWAGPTGIYRLTHGSTSIGDGSFAVSRIRDDDDSGPVLNTQTDRFRLDVDVGAFAPEDLAPGSTVQLSITVPSGGTTRVEFEIPARVDGRSTVDL